MNQANLYINIKRKPNKTSECIKHMQYIQHYLLALDVHFLTFCYNIASYWAIRQHWKVLWVLPMTKSPRKFKSLHVTMNTPLLAQGQKRDRQWRHPGRVCECQQSAEWQHLKAVGSLTFKVTSSSTEFIWAEVLILPRESCFWSNA